MDIKRSEERLIPFVHFGHGISLVPLDGVGGPLDSSPSVRLYAPIFLKIRALEFSDFLS